MVAITDIALAKKGTEVSPDGFGNFNSRVAEEYLIPNKEWGSSDFAISRSRDLVNLSSRQAQPSNTAWIAAAPESRSLSELYDSFIQGNLAAASEMAKRGNKAIPFFIKALDARSKDVQRTAIVKLGEYGEAAEPALPKLIEFHRKHCDEGALNSKFTHSESTINPDLAHTFVSIGPDTVSSLTEELLYFSKRGAGINSPFREESFKCIDVTLQMLEKFGRRAAPALPMLRLVPEIFNKDQDAYSWYYSFPRSLILAMKAIGPKAAPSLMELIPAPSWTYGVREELLKEVLRALDSLGPLPDGTDAVSWTLGYLQDYMNVIIQETRKRGRNTSSDILFTWFPVFKEAVGALEKTHFDKTHLSKIALMLLKFSRDANSYHFWLVEHEPDYAKKNKPPILQATDELKKFGVELSLQFFVEWLYSKDEAECQEAALALTAYGEQMIPYLDKVISGDAPAACKAAAADARNQLLQKVQ